MKTLFYRLTALMVLLTMGLPLFAQSAGGFQEPKDPLSAARKYGFPIHHQDVWNRSLDKLLTPAQPEPAPTPVQPNTSYDSGPSTASVVCYSIGGGVALVGIILTIVGAALLADASSYDSSYRSSYESDSEGILFTGLGLTAGGGLIALLGLVF
jgi:hypothetical protein